MMIGIRGQSNLNKAVINNQEFRSTVGFARVLKGAVSFKDSGIKNINDTYRGEILIGENQTQFAFIKDLEARELANEVMASALGSALGLPMPKAYFALASADVIPARQAPLLGDYRLMFASTDAAAPSVSAILNGSFSDTALRKIAEALVSHGRLAEFYEFDAWSANIDRHPGNFLVSGDGAFWLIDHGFCFTGSDWRGADLNANECYDNRLGEWVTPYLDDEELSDVIAQLGSLKDQATLVDIERVGRSNKLPELLGATEFGSLVEFLKERIPNVQRFAANALGSLT